MMELVGLMEDEREDNGELVEERISKVKRSGFEWVVDLVEV